MTREINAGDALHGVDYIANGIAVPVAAIRQRARAATPQVAQRTDMGAERSLT